MNEQHPNTDVLLVQLCNSMFSKYQMPAGPEKKPKPKPQCHKKKDSRALDIIMPASQMDMVRI